MPHGPRGRREPAHSEARGLYVMEVPGDPTIIKRAFNGYQILVRLPIASNDASFEIKGTSRARASAAIIRS